MRIRQRVVSIAIPILALSALALMLGAVPAQAASLAFVQSSSADPQTSPTSLTVTYAAAQTAGNLNVVIVGWNNATALISSVTDSKGNAYVLAVGPTVQAGVATQAIYYAKNIASAAAGTNIVTVTFNAAASFPDIRIAEYSGVDTVNPVDVVAANQGSTSSSSSGAVTTTNANDLLVAGNVIQTLTTGAGTSFTKRVITSPDGDILEDRIVTATGSYTGTAPVSPAGQWIMQMVAFRAAGGGSGPGITTLNPTSGTIGVSVTITGTNLGSSQGGSTVTFNGTTATPTSWNATTIVVPVPTGATTG
ncbi:MAG TPA: IPT/TIG domain-containing protein, partial [Candidatus Acidoferrales bacterium]|nr:IPT/TIG domain-containing protein [Candidatus Acidoferrales bacterium]